MSVIKCHRNGRLSDASAGPYGGCGSFMPGGHASVGRSRAEPTLPRRLSAGDANSSGRSGGSDIRNGGSNTRAGGSDTRSGLAV